MYPDHDVVTAVDRTEEFNCYVAFYSCEEDIVVNWWINDTSYYVINSSVNTSWWALDQSYDNINMTSHCTRSPWVCWSYLFIKVTADHNNTCTVIYCEVSHANRTSNTTDLLP